MKLHLFLLGMLCALAGCGSGSGERGAGAMAFAPLGDRSFDALALLPHDCLQYRVESRDDSTQIWHADYVYFYLVDENDKIVLDADGSPVASGLLRSQVADLMARQTEIPDTYWRWRVMRSVRQVKGGRVLEESPFTVVDDADLDELIAKDRAARQS